MEKITSVNITAAAVLAQFLLLLILTISSFILGKLLELWVPFYRRGMTSRGSYSFIILVLSITSLGAFFFSDIFVELWKPLYGSYNLPNIKWSTAITCFFILNILCITILVLTSGGSRFSPFSPLYGVMPVLAVFLREPLPWVVAYTVLTIIAFTIGLVLAPSVDKDEIREFRSPLALWFVTVASIMLATVIGLVTQP